MTVFSVSYCNINVPFKVMDGNCLVNIKPILLGLYSSGQNLVNKAKQNPQAIVDPGRNAAIWVDLKNVYGFINPEWTCKPDNPQASSFSMPELSDLILDTLFQAGFAQFKSTKRLETERLEKEKAEALAEAEKAKVEAERLKELDGLRNKVVDFEKAEKARVEKEKLAMAANVNWIIKFMHGASFPMLGALVFSTVVGLFVYGSFTTYLPDVWKPLGVFFAIAYPLFAPISAVRKYNFEFVALGQQYKWSGFAVSAFCDVLLVYDHVKEMPFIMQSFFIITFFMMMMGYYAMVLKIGNTYTQKGLLKTIE